MAEPTASVADQPAVLHSAALSGCPDPDFADVQLFRLPADAPTDPADWARRIFQPRNVPLWVKALMAVRQAMVLLIGVRPAGRDVFTVDAVNGPEALIVERDRHLDFWLGVAVDPHRGLLQATTCVTLHGWRGRLYFLPVRLLHPVVFRSMIAAAIRRIGVSQHRSAGLSRRPHKFRWRNPESKRYCVMERNGFVPSLES